MAAGRFRYRLTALRRRKPPQRAHSGLDSALVWTRERVWTRNMNFADEAAFADEDEADEVEETTDATAAEVARLQAEVDRWQKKVSELADASDAEGRPSYTSSLRRARWFVNENGGEIHSQDLALATVLFTVGCRRL
jgi:hypothetical protein